MILQPCQETVCEPDHPVLIFGGAEDCGCGFEAGTRCSALAPQWYRYCNECISPANRRWMGQLPRRIALRYSDHRLILVHGSGTLINQFIFESTPWPEKQHQFTQLRTDLIVGGHAGLPFIQTQGRQTWVNAGTIGIPANDGTRDVWYLLLEQDTSNALHLSLNRLSYDWRSAQQKMREVGLTHYGESLESGLWPSLDILPETERQRAGQALPHSISHRIAH